MHLTRIWRCQSPHNSITTSENNDDSDHIEPAQHRWYTCAWHVSVELIKYFIFQQLLLYVVVPLAHTLFIHIVKMIWLPHGVHGVQPSPHHSILWPHTVRAYGDILHGISLLLSLFIIIIERDKKYDWSVVVANIIGGHRCKKMSMQKNRE